MKKLFRSLVILVIIILAAFMINKIIARQIIIREANDPADKVLMTLTARGGICTDGPCQYPIHEIRADGSYTNHATLSKDKVDQLQTIIQATDFTRQLPEQQRRCQSHSDGRDAIWAFPQKYAHDRQFVVCETDLSPTTVQRITELLR